MRRLVLVSLLLSGCSGGTMVWFDAAPFNAADAAILILDDSEDVQVFALDLSLDPLFETPFDLERGGRLEALLYDDKKTVDGIELGRLDVVEDGLPLPVANRYLSAEVIEDAAASWRTEPSASELALDLRAAWSPSSPCDQLDIETVPLDTDKAATGIEQIAEGVVWISTEAPSEFFVYDGTLRRVAVEPEGLLVADLDFEDGTLWVATQFPSRLFRGRPESDRITLAEVTTATMAGGVVSRLEVDGERAAYIDKWSRVYFTDQTEPLFDFEGDRATDDTALHYEDDVLLASSTRTAVVWRHANGISTRIDVPNGASVDEISFVPAVGIVVGTVLPTVYRLEGEELVALTSVFIPPARTIVPFPEGLLIGSSAGGLYRFADGQTCVTDNASGEDLEIATPFGTGAAFVPTSSNDRLRIGGPTPLTIVRAR